MSDQLVPEDNSGNETEADFRQWGDEVGDVSADADAPAQPDGAQPEAPESELAATQRQLSERTDDLKRLQAEYVNYKRRVDRDRDQARQAGVEAVAQDLLPTLDAIEQARQHEELTGGFKLVADELEKLAAKHGLVAYGENGDVFDPHLHEAMMAAPSEPGQTEPQCAQVLQRGYKLKDRIVRYARVAVSEPEPGAPQAPAEADEH